MHVKSYQSVQIMVLCYAILLSCLCLCATVVAADEPAANPEPAVLPDINTLLMKSTFKIVGENSKVGTIFILGKPSSTLPQNAAFYVLVTAAHVLDGIQGNSAIIFFRRKDGDNYFETPYLYQIRQAGIPLWVKHPDADVAAVFIEPPPQDNDIPLLGSNFLATDKMLEDYEIYPGREIKVLGFPLGVGSNSAGFPILRTGSVASFPLVPTREQKTFLVDFRIFEGNSGGPVYFHDPSWHKRVSNESRRIFVSHEAQMILGLVSQQVSMTEITQSYLQETKQKYPLSVAEVVHGTLIQETINLLPPKPDTGSTSRPLHQMIPLNSAIDRLRGKVPEESLAQVKSETAQWESAPTETHWIQASEAVTFTATKYSINSIITIMSKPRNGATIKYQTVGNRERKATPTTANQETTCVETLPIGFYYIWTERHGKQTSDINSVYQIVHPEEKIEITEYATSSAPK